MTQIQSLQVQLKILILGNQVFEAEKIVKKIGKDATPIILELAKHKDSLVRRNVIELAGELGDVESCRLVLRSLDDPDDEVRNLAAFQVKKCSHHELIPEMLVAMDKHPDPVTRGALSVQFGMIGNKDQVPFLKKCRQESKDPELHHQIGLALAKLGDQNSRGELIQSLGDTDLAIRFRALQDCLYVQDKTLTAYFGPALKDRRDVVQLTITDEKPVTYGRVCDVAVTVIGGLGFKLSFSAEFVQIRSEKEIEEAIEIVASIPRQ